MALLTGDFRNRRTINKKRRKEYSRLHQGSRWAASSRHSITIPRFDISDREAEDIPVTNNIRSTAAPTSPLETWMEAVERVHRNMGRVTEDAPQEYVEKICAGFLEHHDKDKIHKKIVRLSRFQKSIYRYENEVYALAGVGKEYDRAAEVTKQVNTLLGWVEEVLCYAMVDFQEVKDCYQAKEFMYQA